MNILFLTQVLPYPMDAGPKTRAYLVLRHLAGSGHKVILVSLVRDQDRPESIEHLLSLCSGVHVCHIRRSRIRDALILLKSLTAGKPFLVARDYFPAMARLIKDLVRDFPEIDAIHSDQLWMAPYALHARRLLNNRNRVFTVLDQHNAVFQIPARMADAEKARWKRSLLLREAKNLASYEREICQKFDRIVWVTEEDRSALFGKNGSTAATARSQSVIPIAIEASAGRIRREPQNVYRVAFIGGLHWPPNAQGVLWFRDRIWPKIKSRVPEAVLTIIGKDPPPALNNYMDSSVQIMGYVSDLSPYLNQISVFVVPLLAAGGMRVKILDAWSWGLPVVSTKIGAEGIWACHGENILLADDPDSFADCVVHAMRNAGLSARLSEGARKTLQTRYDWKKIYKAWNEIYPV